MAARLGARVLWGGGLALAALGLRLAAPQFPHVNEKLYSRGFYRHWSELWNRVNGVLPLSIMEYAVILLALALAACLVGGVVCGLRAPRALARLCGELLPTLVLLLGILCMWYLLGGGLNYFRQSFTHYSGLEVRESSARELKELCLALGERADELAPLVQRDGEGVMVLSDGFDAAAQKVKQGYAALEGQYDGVLRGALSARPKAVRSSEVMSYCRITGCYCFFTGEANINVHIPHYSIPSTIGHELAHVCGFMREDEANYIAYAVCRASGEAEARYSGTMLALVHSLNALHSVDRAAWQEVRGSLSRPVDADLRHNSAYWQTYDTTVGKVAEKANDIHLKANDQSDGLRTYGRMVDLLLADFRQDGVI